MESNNCVFCKIIEGKIPAEKIYEDKTHIAFLDMKPINPGHVLVVPKAHEDYVFDMGDENYKELMLRAKTVSKIIKNKLKPKRVGMVVEGFGVPHVHVHLVPINGAMELNPERARISTNEELGEISRLLNR